MTNERIENQCAHPSCNCTVEQDEKWCSPHCEGAPQEVVCGCGHAECEAGTEVESARTARP